MTERCSHTLLLMLLAATAASGCGQGPSFLDSSDSRRYADATSGENDGGGQDATDVQDAGGNDGGAGSEGADGNGTGDAGDADAGGDDDPKVKDKLKRLPKFGLLVNDLECGMCHVTTIGNIVSTRRVPPLWSGSNASVHGQWLAAEGFDANVPEAPELGTRGTNVTVDVTGGVTTNYRGIELPIDKDNDGLPDFPTMDWARLPATTRGSVKTKGAFAAHVKKLHAGNLVLVGTKDAPIELKDDVLVTGDLVIKGWYSGTGTIYVQGNVYIPADLRAVRTAFPFSTDEAAALDQAQEQIRTKSTDALGIATARSIFIADIDKQQTSDAGNETVTVYNHSATPVNRQAAALGTYDVYGWFPGGRPAFDALYENAISCVTQQATQIGSFNLVEAFLYARDTVAGISRRASFSIRGGVVADYFHVVSGAARCDGTPSPVHGHPSNRSYIEYDHRMKTGLLRVLEHVGEAFPKP